jgi:hypothetical protein
MNDDATRTEADARESHVADESHDAADSHGGADDDAGGGHDQDGHGEHAEASLGPIDWAAWGAGLLGVALGLVVVVGLLISLNWVAIG